jgi:predicted nucleic acid-binding protein
MDVFDSNIWIFGLTQTCEEAVSLVNKAIESAYHVGVGAYIFEEVMHNLQRSDHDQEIIE